MMSIEPLHLAAKIPFCSFCDPQVKQVKLILKSAICRLKKLTKTSRVKISQGMESKEKGQGSLGLQRLIKILYQKHQFELKLSQSCSHSSLQNRLRNYLNCKLQDLQLLLQQLCDKIARRNYELELMTVQIKNSEKSAIKLQQIQDLIFEKKQTSLNTEQVRQISKQEEIEVKLQEEPKQIQYVSPQTGTNSECTYRHSPFQYNMFYFGSMFYPSGLQ